MKRTLIIAALTLASFAFGYRSSEAQLSGGLGGGEDGDGTGGVRSPPSRFQGPVGTCGHKALFPLCAQCERWPYNEKCVWACEGAFECRWLTGGICHTPAREKWCRSSMFR